ncbi:alpha-N-acetylgalactosamine-specific lectin-like [Branchiostoma floridae]|uniref:Alpha-N-acetylgalactosamine-specific lectin-like n=1 Tax=Branchiostoma floridae TaxID=7739 RepID=A0A9J7N179_BRAFL|nr:alpha-N-acetylgalactosamine-specific lectin-like [Branchiostoma floridae]
MSKTPASCPRCYTMWNGICYKAFRNGKTFSDAAATCREDDGILAMPRDAETNAFLISLINQFASSVLGPGYSSFWFGLHDRWEDGIFEWEDGSALGTYNNWAPGQPDNRRGNKDCVFYNHETAGRMWAVNSCSRQLFFICQAVPECPVSW